MPEISRRRFLAMAGGVAGATAAGAVLWSQLLNDQVGEQASSTSTTGLPAGNGRILVVIECEGGNDGLNTLVPAVGRYRDERPNLAIAEADLLALQGEDGYAMHPALAPLVPVWEAGHLAAIQGIGFQDQSLSHFAATDIWRAGGGTPGGTSWLGRWLDATLGDSQQPLRAIAIGTDTRTLTADHAFSTVIRDPVAFVLAAPPGPARQAEDVVAAFEATASPLSPEPWLHDVQANIPATLQAVDVLANATEGGGQSLDQGYSAANRVRARLGAAARIIELDVGAQVFVIGLDGFDTHAAQSDRHQLLLSDLAHGMKQFLAAMEDQGRLDDVLVLTTSEFGRRVAENGSGGCDHGAGNMAFLAGGQVKRQITGDLGIDAQVEGNLPVQIDSRSLYAIGLDWLGGPTDEILDGQFDRYDFV